MAVGSRDISLDALLEPDGARAWWRRRSSIVAFVVVLVVVLIGAFATGALGSSGSSYRTATVTRRAIDSELTSVATIEPVSQASVGFPASGTVKSIFVQVGDEVAAGADLAQLDTQSLEADLHTAQASLAQAQLTLEKGLNGEKSSSPPTGGNGGNGNSGTLSSASTGGTRIILTATSTDPEVAAAQQAVLQAQQNVDAALAIASTAYENAVTVCSADPPDNAACQQALDAALAAQKDVQTAQNQLVDASVAYDDLLTQRAAQSGGDTNPSGGSTPSGGSSTPDSSGSSPSGGSVPSTSGGGATTQSPSSADLVSYQKAVDAATAKVAVAQQALDQATITTPIAGKVVAVNMTVGGSVSDATTQNIVVQGAGGFEATTTVGVDDVAKVKVGQRAWRDARRLLEEARGFRRRRGRSTDLLRLDGLPRDHRTRRSQRVGQQRQHGHGQHRHRAERLGARRAHVRHQYDRDAALRDRRRRREHQPRRRPGRCHRHRVDVDHEWTDRGTGRGARRSRQGPPQLGDGVQQQRRDQHVPRRWPTPDLPPRQLTGPTTLPKTRNPMQRSDRSRPGKSFVRHTRRVTRAVVLGFGLVAVTATGAFAQAQGGGPGGFGGLGASGKLTGKSGSTLQIEGFTGTTKVIVTSSTKYRQTEDTDASAITKGACIRVSGDGDTSTAIDATRVSVLDSAQTCKARGNPGRGTNGGGNLPNGGSLPEGGSLPNGGSLPEGGSLPNGGSLPSGGSGPQGSFGGGVTGTVKSVSGDTVVVAARVPKQSNGNSTNSQPKFVKRNVKVTLADSTTISHNVDATDSVLVVGTCVSSEGSTDSVGTVTAKTVTASQPDSSGECTGGFAGGPPSTSGSTQGSV